MWEENIRVDRVGECRLTHIRHGQRAVNLLLREAQGFRAREVRGRDVRIRIVPLGLLKDSREEACKCLESLDLRGRDHIAGLREVLVRLLPFIESYDVTMVHVVKRLRVSVGLAGGFTELIQRAQPKDKACHRRIQSRHSRLRRVLSEGEDSVTFIHLAVLRV